MAKDTGGSAFPINTEYGMKIENSGGMTLRDYFAARAMQGFLANGHTSADDFNPSWEGYSEETPDEFKQLANECYLMADAMIAERNK